MPPKARFLFHLIGMLAACCLLEASNAAADERAEGWSTDVTLSFGHHYAASFSRYTLNRNERPEPDTFDEEHGAGPHGALALTAARRLSDHVRLGGFARLGGETIVDAFVGDRDTVPYLVVGPSVELVLGRRELISVGLASGIGIPPIMLLSTLTAALHPTIAGRRATMGLEFFASQIFRTQAGDMGTYSYRHRAIGGSLVLGVRL